MALDISAYGNAVEVIKAAILRAQYAATKSANAKQLQLYFAVGGYLAKMGEAQKWGSGALDSIGAQLQKELQGLRGFSGRNLRLMRTFCLEWSGVLVGRANLELASADLLSAASNQCTCKFRIQRRFRRRSSCLLGSRITAGFFLRPSPSTSASFTSTSASRST